MNDRARTTAPPRGDEGFSLLEVMVAFLILTTSAVPLLIALADSQRRVGDFETKRTMKQLMEYKLAHVLLDRPAEDQEPIYVDGAEGNFGDEFDILEDKTYWHDEELYYYSYRIDSEEVDLGNGGGVTGEEDEFGEEDRRSSRNDDPGGSPLGGLGAGEEGEEEEEELGQLRYRVTLTVFYRPGNANFDQHMSIVTYVKHPFESEAMTGPDLGPGGGPPGMGGGEAIGGAGGGEGSMTDRGAVNVGGFGGGGGGR